MRKKHGKRGIWAALLVVGLIGAGASSASAQQSKPRRVGGEVSCNVGPVTFSSSGSIGLQSAGVTGNYNPRTREVCAGVTAQGGLGGYGRASGQICQAPGGRTSLKSTAGVGVGVGADALSAGCTVQGTAKAQVPQFRRAPITTHVGR